MVIDPSTNLGRLRLRCADFGDIPYLDDSIYLQALVDYNGSLPRAAKACATYILGTLSFRVHRKLGTLEVFGAEAFKNYKEFLTLTIKDPSFMEITPIAYGGWGTTADPLIQFMTDWNKNFYSGSETQQVSWTANISPNDGSLMGPIGSQATLANGWEATQ